MVPHVHTSIRALCGTDITLNCVHGSDSHKSASREIGFFFGTMFSTENKELEEKVLLLKQQLTAAMGERSTKCSGQCIAGDYLKIAESL
ncbi:hypothetical protein Syun_016322 [Stephania yunnanensis]|uniref:Nucleoside diphosphate kinase-like domain-containing protein n=1 Tax=Stephania yunnanensis TaxID=152371 RepID=A0AAP0P3S4_9MAGN